MITMNRIMGQWLLLAILPALTGCRDYWPFADEEDKAKGSKRAPLSSAESEVSPPKPDPVFHFIYPDSHTIIKNPTFRFQLEVEHVPESGTWGVYLTDEAGKTTESDAIAEQISGNTDHFEWPLYAVPDGTYFAFAKLTVPDAPDILATLPHALIVDRIIGNNLPPTLTMTGIVPRTVLLNTAPRTLQLTASDPEGDPLKLQFEVKKFPDLVWQPVLSPLEPNSTELTYDWDLSSLDLGIYELRIVATDSIGSVAVASANGQFGIAPASINYTTHIRPFLDSYCVSCHHPDSADASAKARFLADDANLETATIGIVPKANDTGQNGIMGRMRRMDSARMPKSGSPQPTARELDMFQLWIWNGLARD